MTLDPTIPFRQEAWTRAIEAFGTSYIFEERVKAPRQRLKWITWLGLAVPVCVGGLAMTFGLKKDLMEPALIVAGLVATIQALLSLIAITSKWDDALSYGLESARANQRLSRDYERLAKQGPPDIAARLEILDASNQARVDLDISQGVSPTERRMGMRAALRQFGRVCAGCHQVPTSMKPSDCDVCGKF